MDTLSREQVNSLIEDIAYVKKAIQKNTSILQQIDFRASLRLMVLFSAITVLLSCAVFQALIVHYHGFASIPATVKAIVFSIIALVLVALGIMKNTGVLKSARTVDPGISLMRLIKEYYTFRIYHHFIPMGSVFVFFVGYAIATGHAGLVVPILSIGVGLIYNTFDTLLRIDEFLVVSYWYIVSGAIVMLLPSISPLLALSLTIGCGLLILSAVWYLPGKKVRGE